MNPESQDSAGDRLPVNDPLGFVKKRALEGRPALRELKMEGESFYGYVTEVNEVDGLYGRYLDISFILDETEWRFEAKGAVLKGKLGATLDPARVDVEKGILLAKVRSGDAVSVRREADQYAEKYARDYPYYDVTIVTTEHSERGALAPAPASPRALRHSPEVA